MASEDVVVRFRAETSQMQRDLNDLKHKVAGLEQQTKTATATTQSLGSQMGNVAKTTPVLSEGIKKSAFSVNLLNTATRTLIRTLIPISAIVGALVVLFTDFGKQIFDMTKRYFGFNKQLSENEIRLKALEGVKSKALELQVKEQTKLDLLVKSLKQDVIERKNQSDALNILHKLYPEQFKNMDIEKVKLSEIKDAHMLVASAILEKAQAEASYLQIIDNNKAIIELEKQLKAEEKLYGTSIKNIIDAKESTFEWYDLISKVQKQLAITTNLVSLPFIDNKITNIKEQIDELKKSNEYLTESASKYIITTTENNGIPKVIGAYAKLRAEISELDTQIKNSLTKDGFASPKQLKALDELKLRLSKIDLEYENITKGMKLLEKQGFNFNMASDQLTGVADTFENTTSLLRTNWEDFLGYIRVSFGKEAEDFFRQLPENFDNYVNLIQDSINNIAKIQNNIIESEIQGLERLKDARLETLEEEYNRKLINEQDYAKKKMEIEKGLDNQIKKLKREQAQREKQLAIFNASIQGAISIIKATNTAERILTALAVATQIGAIISTPLPQFEKGGEVKGKSHKQGGVVAELEGGEYVVRKLATQRYKDEIEAINKGTFESVMNKKYVIPAITKEKNRLERRIEAVFNDSKLLASDNETRRILKSIDVKLSPRRQNLRLKNV